MHVGKQVEEIMVCACGEARHGESEKSEKSERGMSMWGGKGGVRVRRARGVSMIGKSKRGLQTWGEAREG